MVSFFQNCTRFEVQDTNLSSINNSLTIPSSQKSEAFLDYCSTNKSPIGRDISVSISGAPETVWNSPNPNTIDGPIPDGNIGAYRNASGKVSLLIVHSDLYRISGDSLNNLNSGSTERIFKSNLNVSEQAHDHRHWLMAPYSLDGINFVGVNHHEWYACRANNDCVDNGTILNSWANSLTKSLSSDGGNSWSIPSDHLIIAPPPWGNKPYKNVTVMNNHGFFHPSKVVREGSYYYILAFAATSRDLPAASSYSGMMIMRTADFNKWQYWTGGARYVDVGSSDKPAMVPGMDTVLVSLTYNASLCSYMAVYTSGDTGRGPQGLVYKLTASLANPEWTTAKEIVGSRQIAIPSNINSTGFIVNNYPSVLDPYSSGYSFEISGSNPYVYYNNAGSDPFVRNIYRVQLKIEGSGVIVTPQPNGGTTPAPVTPSPSPTPVVTPSPSPSVPVIISPPGNGKVAAGYFAVGEGIYYSNGNSYCYFPSMSSFTQISGRTSIAGILNLAALPTTMSSDGACQGSNGSGSQPSSITGLFKIGDGIYYSNGSTYCFFNSMAAFTANTGRTSAEGILLLNQLPAGQVSHGACQ